MTSVSVITDNVIRTLGNARVSASSPRRNRVARETRAVRGILHLRKNSRIANGVRWGRSLKPLVATPEGTKGTPGRAGDSLIPCRQIPW